MAGSTAPSLVWFVARGSGMAAYVLLTAAVVLGITVSRHWHGERWPRLIVEGAHRWVVLTFFAFILLHTVTILLDPFTHFGLRDVVVPFGSAYRTLWLGLGVLASELLLAVGASVLVRRWIGYAVWHGLHLLTYLLFPLSLLHGLGTGTDTQEGWAALLYAGSVAAVVIALVWRTMALRVWRRWALAGSLAGVTALAIWCVRGPYAPGWAVAAGTPQALLQASARQRGLQPAATPSPPAAPIGLHDTVSGQTFAVGDEGSQLLLRGSGTGTTALDVAVQLVQSRRQIGGEVQLRTADHTPWCAGPITGVLNQDTIVATCSGYGQQVRLQLTFQALNAQGFSGTLQTGP